MLKIRNALVLGSLMAVFAVLATSLRAGASKAEGPQLAHMVYFKLKDNSGGAKAKLTAACKLHLSNHPGTVYFGTGTRAGDLNRQFNDTEYDVSLHLVFANKDALDKYIEHPRHLKFLEENKDNWDKVRVFDSYLSPPVAATSTPGADN